MPIVIYPNQGLIELNKRMISTNSGGCWWGLFVNDIVITKLVGHDDIVNATFDGYDLIHVVWDDFIIQDIVADQGIAIAAPIEFTKLSGDAVDIYGVFVADDAGNFLLQAYNFDDGPITLPSGVAHLKVLPTWGDFSQQPIPEVP